LLAFGWVMTMAENDDDGGVAAIGALIAALKPLDAKTRNNVLDYVIKQLAIELGQSSSTVVSGASPALLEFDRALSSQPESTRPAMTQTDIRTFAEEKQPKTVNEKVALVAYYIRNMAPLDERRDNIVSADIERYFVEAGFALPSAPPNMTLTNAKNAGYLNSAGPGQYRINAVGHNVVAHRLPSGQTPKKKKKKGTKKKRR
jgi:hypothetical protein